MVLAGRSHAFALLRIGIYGVAGRLGGRFWDHFQGEDVALNDRSAAGETAVEHAVFQHLVERSKSATVMAVVIEHLLFGDRSKGFYSRCLVGLLDCRLPARNADRDQDADNCDDDHELDKGKALLIETPRVVVLHNASSRI